MVMVGMMGKKGWSKIFLREMNYEGIITGEQPTYIVKGRVTN